MPISSFASSARITSCHEALSKESLSNRRDSISKQHLREDFLRAMAIRKLNPTKTVTLILGYSGQSIDSAQSLSIQSIVSYFKDRGYSVIYDADSSTARIISQVAGSQGLGISGRPMAETNQKNGVVVIENTSLRMDAFLFRYNDVFQSGHRLIVGLDSTLGAGLLLQNHPSAIVFDTSEKWQDQLQKWVLSLGQKGERLHLSVPPTSVHFKSPEQFRSLRLDTVDLDPAVQRNEFLRTKRTSDEIKLADQYADDISAGEENGISQLGGVVVFCSAVGDPLTDQILERLASYLGKRGVPVVTGGSIATMERVNQAAKDAGGISVGIPIRRPLGHLEHIVPIHAHTITQPVDAHPARLHFLLEGRDAIVIGPGGKGIIKEIGATLVKFAAVSPLKIPKIILIDSSYYNGLQNFLSDLPIPEGIRSRIEVLPIDRADDSAFEALFSSSL